MLACLLYALMLGPQQFVGDSWAVRQCCSVWLWIDKARAMSRNRWQPRWTRRPGRPDLVASDFADFDEALLGLRVILRAMEGKQDAKAAKVTYLLALLYSVSFGAGYGLFGGVEQKQSEIRSALAPC